MPLEFSSPVIIPYHSLLSSTQCHCCSPLPFYPISFSLPSSAYIVLLPRSNPISFSTLSPPVCHRCSPLPFYPISLSTIFPFSATVVLLSRSIPFHSQIFPLQFRCCSPLPFYPISFSTLSPPVPPLFSSPVLSHFILYSLPSSATVVLLSVLSHFILYSLPSSATVVLLSRSIPFHSLLSSLQCHSCSPLPFYPISFSTLFPPVPPLFSSPVLSHFILCSLPSSATVVLLSRSIPFHSLLSSLQCHSCSPLPFYPISFSTLFPPAPLLFSSPVLSHCILYSLPIQCHCCSPLPF